MTLFKVYTLTSIARRQVVFTRIQALGLGAFPSIILGVDPDANYDSGVLSVQIGDTAADVTVDTGWMTISTLAALNIGEVVEIAGKVLLAPKTAIRATGGAPFIPVSILQG